MKTLAALSAALFALLPLSCSDSELAPRDDGFAPFASASEAAQKIVGKWEIEDKNSPYAFIEFTADGFYVIAENAAKNAAKPAAKTISPLAKEPSESNLGAAHFGTYKIVSSGTQIELSQFGTITSIAFNAKDFRISFTSNGTIFIAGGTNPTVSENTELFCRPWLLKKTKLNQDGTGDSPAGAPADLTAMWSKSGTYIVIYNNANGTANNTTSGLSEWEWNETETAFNYSWVNWESGVKSNGLPTTVQIITLNENELIVKEDGIYYFFEPLKVTAGTIIGTLQIGSSLSVTLNNPTLIGETCVITWTHGNNEKFIGNPYTLVAGDIGYAVSYEYACENGFGSGSLTATGGDGGKVMPSNPIITTQPQGGDFNLVETPALFTIIQTSAEGGTLTYQWYKGSTPIATATNDTYTVPAAENGGTENYYVIVTRTVNGAKATTTSEMAQIRRPQKPSPTINSKTCNRGVVCTLTCTQTALNGTLTYRWLTDGGGEAGSETSTFNAPNDAIGVKNYKCEVTNTISAGKFESAQSAVGTVTIELPTPTVSVPTAEQKVLKNAVVTLTPTVSVSDNNKAGLTCLWHSNAANSTTGGTPIGTASADACTNAYNPPTNAYGTLYYYLTATNTEGGTSKSATSAAVKVEVYLPAPEVTPTGALTYNFVKGEAGSISTTATAITSADAALTCKWYSNASQSNTGGTELESETNCSSLAISADTDYGTYYYYMVATNKDGAEEKTATTGVIIVNVTVTLPVIQLLQAPYTTLRQANDYGRNVKSYPIFKVNVTNTQDLSNVTYQWCKSTSNSNATCSTALNKTSSYQEFNGSDINSTTPYYYWVEVTNTADGRTATTKSTPVLVVGSDNALDWPQFKSQSSDLLKTNQNGNKAEFYRNTEFDYAGATLLSTKIASGWQELEFVPGSESPPYGTYYYFAVITNGTVAIYSDIVSKSFAAE